MPEVVPFRHQPVRAIGKRPAYCIVQYHRPTTPAVETRVAYRQVGRSINGLRRLLAAIVEYGPVLQRLSVADARVKRQTETIRKLEQEIAVLEVRLATRYRPPDIGLFEKAKNCNLKFDFGLENELISPDAYLFSWKYP